MSFTVYAAVFVVAALLSVVAVNAARAVSLRLGAVDRGGGRRVHEGVVPRLGGLGIYAVWFGVCVAALAVSGDLTQHPKLIGILLGSLVLFGVGWYDDLRSAGVSLKLSAQIGAAVVAYLFGLRVEVLTNPAGEVFRLGWLGLPLTVAWIVAITNAYNLIDGIDGLAATTGLTICVGMALLYNGFDSLGPFAIVALAGALAGFLRHNFPPARIFMGDCGSQSVGFLLGAFSLLSFAKATTLVALFLSLIVFAHPLVDLAYAVLRRYHRGQPLGAADREHLHHLLLERGYSGRGALGILAVLNIALMLLVVHLANRQLPGVVVILALLTVPAGVAFRIARHILRGGSYREEALAFFMSRERRSVLHQARLFRRLAPAAASAPVLAGLMRSFIGATGLTGVRIVRRTVEGLHQPLFSDETPVSGSRVSVCVSVVNHGAALELLEVSVNRDFVNEGRGSLSDAAGALADGVRGYLEKGAVTAELPCGSVASSFAAAAAASVDRGGVSIDTQGGNIL